MAYYLSFDGVDDTLEIPLITFDEVELDCEVNKRSAFTKYFGNTSAGYLQRNGSNQDNWGTDFTGAFVNGVAVTVNTPFIPINTRFKVKAVTGGVQRNTKMYLFANNLAGSGATGGKIYGVVFRSNGVIVTQYDFTLGHANDISGNGKNATLINGAVFVQDSSGGIPGSVMVPLKQVISRSGTASGNLKQAVYAVGNVTAFTKQQLYSIGSAAVSSKQVIYAAGTVIANMLQVITQGVVPGSVSFPLKQTIYRSGTATAEMLQQVFRNGAANASIKQEIYGHGTALVDVRQQIYLGGRANFATKQVMYRVAADPVNVRMEVFKVDSLLYPTLQNIIDQNNLIVGRIKLRGSRNLRITLLSSRELRIRLKGGMPVATKDQNFTLYAGESKYLDVPVAGDEIDLVGSTIKWIMKKTVRDPTTILSKDTTAGIAITDKTMFTVSIQPGDTDNLNGTYYHESGIVDGAGNVSTIMVGTITIYPSGFTTR